MYIDKRHTEVQNYMMRPLSTAEDVQDMEKFMNNLILEKSVMRDKIDEWRENLFLLIDMDYNISDHTQYLAKCIYEWPKKLERAHDAAYKKHYDDKEAIENAMYKSRDKFERDMVAVEKDIRIVESYDDLFSYPEYILPITKLKESLDVMRRRKERLELEEMIILGIKSSYDSYFKAEVFFDPHYSFWTTVETFLDKKKHWRSSAASKLNIEDVNKHKTDAQNMLKKIKNKMGENQAKLVENMRKQVKDMDSLMSIIEVLSNPGMKDRHWEK